MAGPFGLCELQREMDKQILPDGADYESSTGYHRLVLELFCYSFLLCRLNGSRSKSVTGKSFTGCSRT